MKSALRVARDGTKRRSPQELLGGITLGRGSGAPRDEAWLAAELAYRAGDYADANALFAEFDARADSASAPPWQRYLSAHRRSFGSLQLGRVGEAEAALEEAARIREAAPSLRRRGADLDAMRGHICELRGDFDSARALFEQAYRNALRNGNRMRARTAASDLGRIAAIAGRPSEGLAWLDRADKLAVGSGDARVQRTIALRRATLHAMLGSSAQALGEYTGIIDAVPAGSELAVDALSRRADLLRVMRRPDEARRDLERALHAARARRLRRHELYCHKDLAALLLEIGQARRAEEEFRLAVALALDLEPPQPLVLVQLAQDLLSFPMLVGKSSLTGTARRELEGAVSLVERLGRESAYQRGTRVKARAHALAAISSALSRHAGAEGRELALAACKVNLSSGRVSGEGGGRRLAPADLNTLRLLLGSPDGLTTKQLVTRTGRSAMAVEKSLSRLRQAIGTSSLVSRRRGRTPALHRIAVAE